MIVVRLLLFIYFHHHYCLPSSSSLLSSSRHHHYHIFAFLVHRCGTRRNGRGENIPHPPCPPLPHPRRNYKLIPHVKKEWKTPINCVIRVHFYRVSYAFLHTTLNMQDEGEKLRGKLYIWRKKDDIIIHCWYTKDIEYGWVLSILSYASFVPYTFRYSTVSHTALSD